MGQPIGDTTSRRCASDVSQECRASSDDVVQFHQRHRRAVPTMHQLQLLKPSPTLAIAGRRRARHRDKKRAFYARGSLLIFLYE